MPTKPPSGLLERDLSKAEARRWIDLASPLLQEVVNYGVATFARCSQTAKGSNESFGILLSYLHLIEMVDGVEILLAEAAPTPAELQLRSAFEALLAIEYITEGDTTRRAYAYLVAGVRARLATYRAIAPGTLESERSRDRIAADRYVQDMRVPEIPDLAEGIRWLEALLERPQWREANSEFQAFRKRWKKTPRWYQLFGGPSNLERLATKMKRPAHYDILYRQWSATAHAGNAVFRQLTESEKGMAILRGLRDANRIATVASLAVLFALAGIRCVLSFFRPEEVARAEGVPSFTVWYLREIRERWMMLCGAPVPEAPDSI